MCWLRSGAPLQNEIYQAIRKRILAREFTPGSQLPTEKELAEQLHVSRITVHRALQKLAQEGFILRYPGKGSFVADKYGADFSSEPMESEDNRPLIGFILPDVTDDFGIDVLTSAIAQAEAANWSVLVSFTNQSQEAEETAIRRAVQAGVNGLLVNPVYGEFYNEELLRLHVENFPLVLVDKRLDKIHVPYVTTDNHAAAYELTKHLIDLGHRHIGFISPGVTATATLEDRFAGYLAALEDHGIPYEPPLNLSTLPTGGAVNSPDGPEVRRTIQNYLAQHNELTAIVATEYVFASILDDICREMNLSIPDDLSVVCFDSPKLAHRGEFTHIAQEQKQIGAKAVDMLLRIIREEKSDGETSILLPGKLVTGRSSAAPSVCGMI